MLEDESGRLRLIGGAIVSEPLVTGCVIAVMGSETADGDFDVIDVLLPNLPPQVPLPSQKMQGKGEGKYVALISGANISGGLHESLETGLMVEYLLGELTSPQVLPPLSPPKALMNEIQTHSLHVQDQNSASKITRLIMAGNSLSDAAPLALRDDGKKNVYYFPQRPFSYIPPIC